MSYGRDIAFGLIEHPWRKVLDQCFVIRREAYFQAGGFEPEFGHFAEWLIAARFHTLGLPIGYVPAVRIHHLYSGQFGEWQRFTADFIEGQMRFLGLEPSDPLRTMFDEVPEWSGRHSLQRDASRRICRLLTRDLRAAGASSGRVSRLREWHWGLLAVWAWRSVAGDAAVLVRAPVQRMSARLLLQAGPASSESTTCRAASRTLFRGDRETRADPVLAEAAPRFATQPDRDSPARRSRGLLEAGSALRGTRGRVPPGFRHRPRGDSLVGACCLRRAPARSRPLRDQAELALSPTDSRQGEPTLLSRRT